LASALGISFINLKGGVAKTTTTVVVAEMLDSEFGKKDLDRSAWAFDEAMKYC
jgi:cellulose biosynthesis protein BcsQ